MLAALKTRLFGNFRDASKSAAKSRLHFVLVQDRAGLTSDELSLFKEEMVAVIEKYFVVKKDGFDISYERKGETTTMLINSPIIVRKHQSSDPAKAAQAKTGKSAYLSRKKRKARQAEASVEGQV